MKNGYGKALCTFVLMVVLASSAVAGEIQHPTAQPTPAPATAPGEIQHPTATNSLIQTGETATMTDADTMTAAALNLLQSVLMLF